jgi:hypothetical protein
VGLERQKKAAVQAGLQRLALAGVAAASVLAVQGLLLMLQLLLLLLQLRLFTSSSS